MYVQRVVNRIAKLLFSCSDGASDGASPQEVPTKRLAVLDASLAPANEPIRSNKKQ